MISMGLPEDVVDSGQQLQFEVSEETIGAIQTEVLDRFPERGVHRREYFKLYKQYTELFLAGEKTTTVRYDPDGVDIPAVANPSLLVSSSKSGVDTAYIGDVTVSDITIKRFEHLDEPEARADGFRTAAELKNALHEIYELDASDFVTIYSIEPEGSMDQLKRTFDREVTF